MATTAVTKYATKRPGVPEASQSASRLVQFPHNTEVIRHHGNIIGNSRALRATLRRLEAVAATPATALILGESGVGKELVARAIHQCSPRKDRRLIKVNCASIPEELFEIEFFGHVKGSFTGAHRDRVGRFELANHGTLFLDEVAEIPSHLQAKLLRVLQEGQFERIGDENTRSVDVRVVAATNRDLQQAVAEGSFREDLYYRLSVFPIHVPPLRHRKDDIVPLAVHVLEATCDAFECALPVFDAEQFTRLLDHPWPGNVRELRNLIERTVILSMNDRFDIGAAMPKESVNPPPVGVTGGFDQRGFVKEEDWQRSYRENIVSALKASNWRISGDGGAADLLGINASTLRGRMKSLEIPMPRDAH